jgi:hypothetical protein
VEILHCPRPRNSKNVPSASEVILLFWNFSGPILKHYQNHEQTVLCYAWRRVKTRHSQYVQRNADIWSCFAWWQHLNSYSSSNCWNNVKSEIQGSPPSSIQSRSRPHVTTILSDCWKMCYIDANLQTMKRSRMWCIHGFTWSKKHSSQVALGSSWTEATNVCRSYGIILKKNDSIFVLVYLFQNREGNEFPLVF